MPQWSIQKMPMARLVFPGQYGISNKHESIVESTMWILLVHPHIDINVKSNDGGFPFELPALAKLGRVNDEGWNGSTPGQYIMEKETSIKEMLPKLNKEQENVPR